jgi:hypothetical protein
LRQLLLIEMCSRGDNQRDPRSEEAIEGIVGFDRLTPPPLNEVASTDVVPPPVLQPKALG